MSKIAYSWNIETNEYKCIRIAKNKSDIGEYQLPGNSTWDKPPEHDVNQIAVMENNKWVVCSKRIGEKYYDDNEKIDKYFLKNSSDIPIIKIKEKEIAVIEAGKWQVKKDYRGEKYYDKVTKKKIVIDKIGIIPTKEWTVLKPPLFTSWSELKNTWVLDLDQWLNSIRDDRNDLLKETDWTQLPDVVLTIKQIEEYKIYRQALRDLPTIITFDNPEFPIKPE